MFDAFVKYADAAFAERGLNSRNHIGLAAERFAGNDQQASLGHAIGGFDDSFRRRPAKDYAILREEFVASRKHALLTFGVIATARA
jgi:hypothetical protein